jgi:hypothetical protein
MVGSSVGERLVSSFDPSTPRTDPPRGAGVAPFSIDECRSCEPALRQELETLDYQLRSAVNQILAGVEGDGRDGAAFLRGATTVLLSVAAGLIETASERLRAPTDIGAFKDVAEDAAQWAKDHKLRELLDGDGRRSDPIQKNSDSPAG